MIKQLKTVKDIPDQTGNSGKYLTTNGSVLSWVTISTSGLTNFTESNYFYNKYGVKFTPNSAQTDVDIVLQPKGTGGIIAKQPDGTTVGGRERGVYCVDLMSLLEHDLAGARGDYSTISGGRKNYAQAIYSSVSGGWSNNVGAGSDGGHIGGGQANTLLALYSTISGGKGNVVYSGDYSTISGGLNQMTYLPGQSIIGGYSSYSSAPRQSSYFSLQASTSNATPTEIYIDGSSRLVMYNNTAWAFRIIILAHSSTNVGRTARFERIGTIYRIGTAATTALEGSVQTIGTDIINTNLSGVAVAITADTTNGSLKVAVTGLASTTIIWQAKIEIVEISK